MDGANGKPTGGRIHFGSLEAVEARNRQAAAAAAAVVTVSSPASAATSSQTGVALDELKTDDKYEQSESSKRARDQHMEIMEMFERRKRARSLAVPTDDKKVREKLRELGEPQCLFGEDNMDRRTRLRELMAKDAPIDGEDEDMVSDDEKSDSDSEEEEEVYTPGTESLLKARKDIAHYSLSEASKRVARQTEENKTSVAIFKAMRAEEFDKLKASGRNRKNCTPITLLKSVMTDHYPNVLSPRTAIFWPLDPLEVYARFGASRNVESSTLCEVGGIKWHPKAHISQSRSALNLATGGGDGIVNLWSLESETPIQSLKGHTARVARIGFHPMGRFLGSAGYDGTWRLWDVEAGAEILTQRGHSREVYAIGFQCDGSLAATGGLDSVGRVWDLRTGRSALTMEGHVNDILGIDFSPNGYQIATGSADNSIRIWDLRTLRSIHSIPAHTNLVSDIKFYPGQPDVLADTNAPMQVDGEQSQQAQPSKSGVYLGSCSFDGTIKLWSADDWKLQKSLVGHTGKVTGLDISSDGRFVGSSGFDRTFKLWAPEDAAY
ncbi:hypothetical protein BGX31_005410 [Mortierella sp. GBA43]|nr:hypothetical protein BGX31_005410 [Mortierella sp. GBA43]